MRYNIKKYYLKHLCIMVLLSIYYSCYTDDPQLIQLPDKTPPSGYIINPIDGSSISGNVSIEVIAIDNEEIDSVYFLIKSQNSTSYQNIDSTKKQDQDIWKGSWNTTNSQWIENENYFVTFRAIDLAGNTFIASPIIVKVDNQDDEPPLGYILNPVSGQMVNGTVNIEVEASDNTSLRYVKIYINNELRVTHSEEPYTYTWNTENETDDLVYSIYAVLVDVDNNTTTIPPISVTVNNLLPTDVSPPTGAITSPPGGSTVSGNTLIQVTSVDDQLIDFIEYYIDGDLVETYQCNGPSCTGSYNWDTSLYSEGEHTVQVIIVDGWNNSTVLTSINVWVDNIDDDTIYPNIVIIEPASGQTVNGDVLIEALAIDNIGIEKVEFYINAELVHTDESEPEYNFIWSTDTLTDDLEYIITSIAYDISGNEAPSTSITVFLDNYDNVLPDGYISYPYAGQSVSGIETILVNASDNNSVVDVKFYINNILVSTDDIEPYEYNWDTSTELEDINCIIGATVTDNSNNIYTIPSISVSVNNIPNDTSPPIVVISNPTSGQTVSGIVDFTVLANDDSGIALVELYIDGDSMGIIEQEPYLFSWDTTSEIGDHSDQHTLSARAQDTAGNISFAQPILVIVEN